MSLARRKFILKAYIRENSIGKVQKLFKKEYRVKSAPSKSTVWAIVQKFEEKGTVSDLPQPDLKCRSVCCDTKVQHIQDTIDISPSSSIRQVASQTGISKSSAQRMLRYDRGLKPYKVTLVQTLKEDDPARRVEFCEWFLETLELHPSFLDNLFVSDESTFQLNGTVNSQNYRVWGLENPHLIAETKTYSPKITMWIAMSSDEVIGPYFFEDRSIH